MFPWHKGSKRSLYKIADPFMRFWFRFANPRRSLAEARNWPTIERELAGILPGIVGEAWEDLARWSVPRMEIAGARWGTAARWWGPGLDRQPMEVDVAAASEDGSMIILGEAKLRIRSARGWREAAGELRSKLERFPLVQGRKVIPCIWYVEGTRPPAGLGIETVIARRIFW